MDKFTDILIHKIRYRLSDMAIDMTSPKDGEHKRVSISHDDIKQMWQAALDSGNKNRIEAVWHTVTWLHKLFLDQKH